jgi:NAD(P)H dehydrogenase (quinone)
VLPKILPNMNVLIIFAHPEAQSFNGALKDVAVDSLSRAGHDVVVSDLYGMGFYPATGVGDFAGRRVDPGVLSIAAEQTKAVENGTLSPDIAEEQKKVLAADLVVFQFPMWWFSMPSILKGWVDRVFARGFAYLPGRKYDTGMLAGRRAMLSVTTGTSRDTYRADGIDGDINDILWPIHNGILRYTGFDVLPPFVAYMPGRISAEERKAQLDAYRNHIGSFETMSPLFFHPLSDYGPDERLKPGVVARSGFQRTTE